MIPDEDDILDMFRQLPKTGTNGRNDHIVSAMRKGQHRLPVPLCLLVTDLLHTSEVLKGTNSRRNSLSNSQHGTNPVDETATNGTSCFATLSDVLSDIQQMIDLPDAFLYASMNSRWELVFGNNHMFGREGELRRLLDAADRIQNPDDGDPTMGSTPTSSGEGRRKEAITVAGHAGSGKSRLVREIRKPLQQRGWLFLRCKFGKAAQSAPLSVIALGLDEFFSSGVACGAPPAAGARENVVGGCMCANRGCPRRVCQKLESLIGLDGLKCLSQQMPSLRGLISETRAQTGDLLNGVNGARQAKFHTDHLFGTLLDTLASFSPVLFFGDDLQWAAQ